MLFRSSLSLSLSPCRSPSLRDNWLLSSPTQAHRWTQSVTSGFIEMLLQTDTSYQPFVCHIYIYGRWLMLLLHIMCMLMDEIITVFRSNHFWAQNVCFTSCLNTAKRNTSQSTSLSTTKLQISHSQIVLIRTIVSRTDSHLYQSGRLTDW